MLGCSFHYSLLSLRDGSPLTLDIVHCNINFKARRDALDACLPCRGLILKIFLTF